MSKAKENPTKTVLIITIGFLCVFLFSKWEGALWISFTIGFAGILSPYLSGKIDLLWMQLAHLLSLILPNIILSLFFYCFLFPISLLSKIFGKKDPLNLKNRRESNFITEQKTFQKASFEKPW